MALTIEQIHATADQIAAQGERPTLARVRAALGSGSFSTIGEAMQSWRRQQSEARALSEVQVPEAVADRVQQLQAAAWQTAIEEAERRLASEREALREAREQTATDVREAVRMLEAEAEERDRDLATLRHQLDDAEAVARDALACRQQAEQQAAADAARLGERIKGLEARLTDAVDARKSAEAREVAAVKDAKATGKRLEEVRLGLGKAERVAATAEVRAQACADALRVEQEARQAVAEAHRQALDELRARCAPLPAPQGGEG